MSPMTSRRRARLVLALALVAAVGCRSTGRPAAPPLEPAELAAAAAALGGGTGTDVSALYRLRVPRASGLRATLRTLGPAGRLTVSEPFGAAVSLIAWEESGRGDILDLKEGCRVPDVDLAAVLGVGRLPLDPMLRLLVGRLPAADDDRVTVGPGHLRVEGFAWQAMVHVARDPWRVTRVESFGDGRLGVWRIELGEHHGAVPGVIRIDREDGSWARLELLRLALGPGRELPAPPDLPDCRLEGEPS